MSRNFSTKTNYTKRKLFLDGEVTIQRYDEFAFPKVAEYDEKQRSAFWVPEEITLTKDKMDFKEANAAVRHIFTSNILRQTTLDSIQGRAPVQVFGPVCSVPELESLMTTWSWFEIIHSRSYSHLIRNIYNQPTHEFNKIHDNAEIIAMTSSIGKYYDDLHLLNSKIVAGLPVTEHEMVKAVWMALIASYGLEAIRFMVSFATSLGMVENRIFIGNGNIIRLILADELLHTDWTAWLINHVVKIDPRFRQIKEETKQEVAQVLASVVEEEKKWADYLFMEGPVIGLNASIMKDFVDWTAQEKFKVIGVHYNAGIKHTPLPWFNKHLNTNKSQTALQENESTSYLSGVMTNEIKTDDLPDL